MADAGLTFVKTSAHSTLRRYYSLTKPGVLYGNVITGVAGFLLGAGYFRSFEWLVFTATIVGMTLVIASACVLNNYLDQDIDAKMKRTKSRAIPAGEIRGRDAVLFSIILGVLGIIILAIWVNWLVVAAGVFGFVVYVWLYGALSKRLSVHGTLVGSISGAVPILAGYMAVSDRFDVAALLVFLMLFFWQFPEFYSIAIYRKKEYAAAGIPVMTAVKGIYSTKVQIFAYTVFFVVSALLLTIFGYTGWLYFVVMAVVGVYWIRLAARGLPRKMDDDAWAHKMFHSSLMVLMILSLMLAIGAYLP